jgi:hypothetical protein
MTRVGEEMCIIGIFRVDSRKRSEEVIGSATRWQIKCAMILIRWVEFASRAPALPSSPRETILYARNCTGLNLPLEGWSGTTPRVTSIKTNALTPIFPSARLCCFVGKMTEVSMINDGKL